jgi:tRNA pseudouridine38-40 synthase
METVRLRLTLAYDGAGFHGFAEQKDVRTVAGELRATLERLFGTVDDFTCAGRTDTGVHAWGQVVHADVPAAAFARYDPTRIQAALNKQLAPSVVVRGIEPVDGEFNARFSATARQYRYLVLNTPLPSPFVANTTWWVPEPLDIDAMNEACAHIIGEHDFTSFCRRPKGEGQAEASLTRRVLDASWTREEEMVRFDIRANAFCHQMVRALTGMLVEIGKGRRTPNAMNETLQARDRSKAAPLAPPQGLCLREVEYG